MGDHSRKQLDTVYLAVLQVYNMAQTADCTYIPVPI